MASGEIARRATFFFVSVALARLLTPGDYGLVAMAAFVVGFVEIFARTGSQEALVQQSDVSAGAWSSVYWFTLGLAGFVAVAVWLLAPLASLFFRDDRVVPIVRALGWTTLLAAVGSTQRAWFVKELRFRTIAQIEWCGVLAGGAAGLALAASGYGVWSLVGASLVGTSASALLFYLRCPWRPSGQIQSSEIRRVVRFGVGLQGFAIVNYFNRRLDDALIGRYLGPIALGYYTRAYDLMLYPVQNIGGVVSAVMFPALAEIGDDLVRFRAAYLRAVSAIATVTFPIMLGLLVTAPEAIEVVYGRQWAPAVSILQVLCLVGALQAVAATAGNIFMARARTGLMFACGVGAAAVIYPSFFIGLHWGVMGVAVAYAIANVVLLVPELAIPYRLIGLRLSDLVRAIRGIFLGSVLMAGVVALIRHALLAGRFEPHTVLGLSIATGILTYGAWLWVTDAEAIREMRLLTPLRSRWGGLEWASPNTSGAGGKREGDSRRPVVAHFVLPYLFRTGSWIHSPLINGRRYDPIVVTDRTENLDIFPFSPIYAYSDLGYARKIALALRERRLHGLCPAFFSRVLRKQHVRLIHAHFGQVGADLLDLRRRSDIRMVTSFYGADVSLLARDPVWRARYQRLFAEGHAFLAEGNAMRRALLALGCPPDKVIIHHLGVPLASLPFAARKPDASGVVKILIAGTFREKKGIPDALRTIERVQRRYPRLRVTLIGDSAGRSSDEEEKREILALVHGLSGVVTWIGYQPYTAFAKMLLDHHIFLSPSLTARDGDSEGGAPVAIIEAEATGMPIVATTHADIPEVVVPGQSAFLSPERDVDGLAEHLERLVMEPKLWEPMGRRGRSHVEAHHDTRVQAARLEDIYDTVLRRPGG
jgi:O-antigen/teichoic acid export membrane protein/glycosyltransferase involved in cell wall biosynthesis